MTAKLARVLSIGPGLGMERIPIAKRFGGKVAFFAVDKDLSRMYPNAVLKRFGETESERKKIAALCLRQKKREIELDFKNPGRLREQLLEVTGGNHGFFREIHFYAPLFGRGKNAETVLFKNSVTAQKILGVLSEFLEPSGYVYHAADEVELSPLLGGLPTGDGYAARKKALAERLGDLKLQRYGEREHAIFDVWHFGSTSEAVTRLDRAFNKLTEQHSDLGGQYSAQGGTLRFLFIARKQGKIGKRGLNGS